MAVVHAIVLGLCILVTELACGKERRVGAPGLQRIAMGVGAALVVAGAGFAVGLHRCDLGQPLQQWLIPAACVGCVVAYVQPRRARWRLAGVLGVLGVALSLHYGALVHGPTYVGTSDAAVPPVAAWHTPLTGLYLR